MIRPWELSSHGLDVVRPTSRRQISKGERLHDVRKGVGAVMGHRRRSGDSDLTTCPVYHWGLMLKSCRLGGCLGVSPLYFFPDLGVGRLAGVIITASSAQLYLFPVQ